MSRILILLLLLAVFIVPVSADYNSSGTVDYSYSETLSYDFSGGFTGDTQVVTSFRHLFTDAKVLNSVIFKDMWSSTLPYSKNDVTTFDATVAGTYYGSGVVSIVEQLDNSIFYTVDFHTVDVDYAETLSGEHIVYLAFADSITNGLVGKSVGYFNVAPYGVDTSHPTQLIRSGSQSINYVVGSSYNYVQTSYSIDFSNSYNYNFNSTYNISSLEINRSLSSSDWSVYDSEGTLYFEDQSGYSAALINQDFLRYAGVYANTSYNTASGPVSIYTTIDVNGTAITPGAPPGGSGFDYNITAELDEYAPGDIVNVTYSTDIAGSIQVVDTVTDQVFHSKSFGSGAINGTWQYYISEGEDFGFFDVYLLDSNNAVLDSYRYILLPQDALESYLHIVQSSVNLYEEVNINVQTANASIFTIENPDGVEVWNDSTFEGQEFRGITFTPTVNPGVYTAYLYDDATLSDTIMVWPADSPPVTDPGTDPVTNETIIEDIIEDDQTMTEYFEAKFRDFAPTAWGIFLLSIVLWFMSILVSFGGSGGKKR